MGRSDRAAGVTDGAATGTCVSRRGPVLRSGPA
jgi:hypothetical protein